LIAGETGGRDIPKYRANSFQKMPGPLGTGCPPHPVISPEMEKMKYDKVGKNILDAYESGNMKLSSPSKKEIENIKAIAKNTFKKNKRITIRLYDHDFKGIQRKALEMGIPYQTLISGLIHRYIEGELVSKIR